jgi:hypothetical protein
MPGGRIPAAFWLLAKLCDIAAETLLNVIHTEI